MTTCGLAHLQVNLHTILSRDSEAAQQVGLATQIGPCGLDPRTHVKKRRDSRKLSSGLHMRAAALPPSQSYNNSKSCLFFLSF